MIYPTIHLNGTAKEDLVERWNDAYTAVVEAIGRLQESGPNGRDYYPQGPAAFTQAQAEHLERLHKLQSVRADLDELREHVMFPVA